MVSRTIGKFIAVRCLVRHLNDWFITSAWNIIRKGMLDMREKCVLCFMLFSHGAKNWFWLVEIFLFDTWHFLLYVSEFGRMHFAFGIDCSYLLLLLQKIGFFLLFMALVLLWIHIFNSFMISWAAIICCWRVISFIICFIRIDSWTNDAWGSQDTYEHRIFDCFHVKTYILCLWYLH